MSQRARVKAAEMLIVVSLKDVPFRAGQGV